MDGLVLIDVLLTDEEAEVLAREGANVVTVGQHMDAFPSVTVDERAAAREAVRHLVSLGHTRIAFVGSAEATPLQFDVPTERRAGYRDVLDEAGLRHDPTLEVAGDFRAASGHAAMAWLLSLPDPPSGVFAISDEMAIGAMRAARDHGRDVPDDISVVGFDDHDFAEVFGLTTVHQDPQWQGETAGRLLLGRAADPDDTSRHPAAAFELVIRSSTGRRPSGGR
jgi:LacI family repressor for deo operon, udp, cdd, tsx, nupC, and nupG